MMIIDNSEYMRNGDYQPTRFEAQADAVNTVFRTKIDSNPENTVGIMTMAGKGPEVLVTHTKEQGQIIQAVHSVSDRIGGEADIATAIAVAQLALKHRQNKNLRQRIVVFVGSPLAGQAAEESNVVKLAKKLKKNNVAVDFVAFGDGIEEGPSNVLRTFSETASSADNSHYIAVPPGQILLSDALLSSAVLAADRGLPDELMGEAGPPGQGEGSAAGQFEFGVDPSLDPELAMALRMSMEEEEARLAAAAQPTSAPAPEPSTPKATVTTTETVPADPVDEGEAAMLKEALAMSKENDEAMEEDEDDDEEEAIQKAIAMSMRKEDKEGKKS
jgi:26S proteasome regulatory subunit N10